jgi:hypothetical protein
LWPGRHKIIKRFDCPNMLGKMVTTGDQLVCVSGERGVSVLLQLGLDIGLANLPSLAKFSMPSQTATTVYAFAHQVFS